MPELKTQQVWYRPSLTTQILIGLVVGVLIGWLRPAWGNSIYFLRDIFLNLIKSIIGPLVFSTLVVGIAGGGGVMALFASHPPIEARIAALQGASTGRAA